MTIKLAYYKSPEGNVGDDFSPWLFSKAFGNHIVDNGETLLFGVGSILDKSFENAFSKGIKDNLVFGSGARNPDTVPDITNGSWYVYCVRGPLTATALNLPLTKAIADPAILAPNFLPRETYSIKHSNQIGIVPYFSASMDLWKKIAKQLGWKIISPHLQVEDFVKDLLSCEKVYCESMHGAIFADAYRIPWRPLSGSSISGEGSTHAFKWTDWTSSMGIGFDSLKIPSLRTTQKAAVNHIKNEIKITVVKHRLIKASRDGTFYLSKSKVIAEKQDQLSQLLSRMSEDIINKS